MCSHLDWVLDQLLPLSSQLAQLQSTPGVTMFINCIWWSAYGQGGPILSPEQMKKMADLHLECNFDISFYGEDEDTDNE
ncbi:MAG: DUF4279 domain-containing protein [Chloroflexota bacterium]